jgi:hypothetical protein
LPMNLDAGSKTIPTSRKSGFSRTLWKPDNHVPKARPLSR